LDTLSLLVTGGMVVELELQVYQLSWVYQEYMNQYFSYVQLIDVPVLIAGCVDIDGSLIWSVA
jgi:hypothetical protein